jgi:hypothetical protein
MSRDPTMRRRSRSSRPVVMHRAAVRVAGRSAVIGNRLDLWGFGVSVMSVGERTESRKRQPEGQR